MLCVCACVRVVCVCECVVCVLCVCACVRGRLLTGSVMGLDFSQLQLVGSDHLDKSAADLQQTLLVGRDSVRTAEPYTTEDFSHVRGGACPLQHCSPAESLLMRVNFADPEVRARVQLDSSFFSIAIPVFHFLFIIIYFLNLLLSIVGPFL